MNLLFPVVCVPVRLTTVLLAYRFRNNVYFKILAALLAVIASIGFFYNDYVDKKVGFSGAPRYWSGTAHGILFSLFVITLFKYPEYAWLVLLSDLILGIITVTNHYS